MTATFPIELNQFDFSSSTNHNGLLWTEQALRENQATDTIVDQSTDFPLNKFYPSTIESKAKSEFDLKGNFNSWQAEGKN